MISTQDLNPSLKLKIEVLEGKYNKFINNCNTFLQDDSQSKSQSKIYLPPEHIEKKREPFNEYHKEALKLRRENSVLIKTVQSLSSRIANLDKEQAKIIVDKQFEEKSGINRKILNKQERDILAINQELEKSRVNTVKTKSTPKDPEAKPIRSSTPGLCKKTQKLPPAAYKFKEFSPIFKERVGSPISRSVSPKDRANHRIKKEINSLKTELEQVKEERNLYKSWKNYCSNHPPVPPAIHSIINHYEIEINQLMTLNSVITSKSDSLAQAVTNLLKDLEKPQSKRNGGRDLQESLKSQVRIKIKELQQQHLESPVVETLKDTSNKLMKISVTRLEEENQNLQEILRREKTLSDILVEAIKIKSEENSERRNTIGMLSTSDRFEANSVVKAGESIGENQSAADTPYRYRNNFEMSFNSREKFNSCDGVKEIIEAAEGIVTSALENLSVLTERNIRQVGLVKDKIGGARQSMQQKIKNVEDKWRKEANLVEKLRDTVREYEEIQKDKLEKISSEKVIVMELQQEINRNRETQAEIIQKLKESEKELERVIDINSFHEGEMNKMADALNSKDKEIEVKQEIINKNEGDKIRLDEKILALTKENDFIRKANEVEHAKLQAKNDLLELKEVQEKLQVTQITLSELELIHKKTEEELRESYKQIKSSQAEAELTKRQMKEDFDIILEQQEKNHSISQQLILAEIAALKESHCVQLENIQEQCRKEVVNSMELVNLARNQAEQVKKASTEEIDAVLKESERALSSLSRQIKAQKEGKDEERIMQDEIESIRKEAELEISVLSQKLVKTKTESESAQMSLQEEITDIRKKSEAMIFTLSEELMRANSENESLKGRINEQMESIRKESFSEVSKIQQQLRYIEDKSEEEKRKLQREIDSIISIDKLALSELSQQVMQNKIKSKNKKSKLKEEIESNLRESELKLLTVSEELRNLKIESQSQITILQAEIESTHKNYEVAISRLTEELNASKAKSDKQKRAMLEEIKFISKESENLSEDLKNTKITNEDEISNLENLLVSLRNESELELSKLSEQLKLAKIEKNNEKRTLQEQIESIRTESNLAILTLSEKLKATESERECEKVHLQESYEALLSKYKQECMILSQMLEKQPSESLSLSLTTYKIIEYQFEHDPTVSDQKNFHGSAAFVMVFENSLTICSEQNILTSTSDQPEAYSSSDLIEILSFKLNLEIDLAAINEIISQYLQIGPLCEKIKELEEKNKIIETVYKKLTEDVKVFQETYKEKIEDLKLDKYELEKELDDQKKKFSRISEEIKKIKEELQLSEQGRKELSAQRSESENTKARLIADIDEKCKTIAELNLELLNSSNYAEKLVNEKDLMEREKSNIVRSVSSKQIKMDGSQAKNEITFLQSNISNLESLNSSLEKAKSLLEVRYKKLKKEKEETHEKLDEYTDLIEGLKQTRTHQEQQIDKLQKSQQSLMQDLELEKKSTTEYKNKLATVMVNSTAMKGIMRSLTPPPLLKEEFSSKSIVEEREVSQSRLCKTAENEISPESPSYTLESLMHKIEKCIESPAPDCVIRWCQKILGSENYLLRYSEEESGASEESKSLSDSVSVSEANNQDISYRAHAKLVQQKKIIDAMTDQMKEKKQRIRVCKDHIRTLQNEIRKLDQKTSMQSNFDMQYLRVAVLKFSEKLRGLDKDSLTMLQIIYSQLGLKNEDLPTGEGKKKWNFFKSKDKK